MLVGNFVFKVEKPALDLRLLCGNLFDWKIYKLKHKTLVNRNDRKMNDYFGIKQNQMTRTQKPTVVFWSIDDDDQTTTKRSN